MIFVLIDRLFSDEWNEKQATLVWDALLKNSIDKTKLIDSIDNVVQFYTRSIVLIESNKTIRHLKESFNREDHYVQDRLQNLLNESDVPSRQWGDIVERVSILDEFLKKQLTRKYVWIFF